ncbi:MAG: chromosome segregation protein SMC [Calditrichaeota bacterium]|nr:MAG: chromosome segregation protein SMC [Calditrichota bacterium]
MYLSQLNIHGFKSFANKIKLDFDSGLTAIIGPNGSGKSNIVDAIRWVLGEQRASSLRSDKMESVIFNGTKSRKPMGMAEVSLTIQNNRNVLDSEYSEVVISRRLYRSGESQYLINKVPVRLKDVINLFMDTGMGANSYSVIELKMVESILSENKQERRVLFEEAAGVVKYKTRRKSALRKLDATRVDLDRINDIILEVEKNVASLNRQVGKARRYLEYTEKLKKLEIDLAVYRYHNLRDRIAPLEKELSILSREKEESSHQITIEEALLEDYNRQSIALEQELKSVRGRIYELDTKINTINRENAVAETRITEMAKNRERYHSEIDEYNRKIETWRNNIEEMTTELDTLKENQAALQTEFNLVAEERRAMQKQIEAEKAHIDRLNRAYREKFQALSNKKEAIDKKNYQLEFNKEQIEKVEIERERLKKELDAITLQIDAFTGQSEDIEEKQSALAREMDRLRQQDKEWVAQLEELRNRYNEALSDFEKVKSRQSFYENVISKYEGHAQSTQYVMTHRREFPGVHGPLAELIQAGDAYAALSEQALGEALNYIVVDTVEVAEKLIQTVREQNKGRITCIPLDRINTIRAPELPAHGNRLVDHLEFDDAYRNLLHILLGDVLIVENLPEAIRASAETAAYRYISRDGHTVRFGREISGGSSKNEAHILSRKNKLKELRTQAMALEKRLLGLSGEMDKKSEALAEIRDRLEIAGKELEEIRTRYYQQNNEARQAQYRRDQMRRQWEASATQIQRLTEQNERLKKEADDIQLNLREEQDALNELEKESIRRTNDFDAVNDTFQQLLDTYQNTQLRLSNANNQVHNRENDIRRSRQSVDEARKAIERLEKAIRDVGTHSEQLKTDIESRMAQRNVLWEERDTLDKKREELELGYNELKDKRRELENEIREYRRKHDSSLEKSKNLEVKINEYNYKTESIRQTINETYSVDIDAHIPSEHLEEDETEQEIQSLKNRIKHLGPVNPLAVSEYEKENERLTFLSKQRDDLERAEASLVETIDKINTTAREKFVTTFDAIKGHFERVFSSFFPNGKGTIRLDESKDPLEADIDIEVTAKGRHLQTLSLLSGGEKTLTAISLLFSIYLVKPSPFCILDEVDAPLDDVNIKRFTDALQQFTDTTQFLVVTHNKRTMEAAKNMYGVTMEEEGVSKIVSVAFQ